MEPLVTLFHLAGMNLQICFMNETLSDTESPSSEGESRTNIIDSSVPVTALPKPETEGEWIKESSHLSSSTKVSVCSCI